MTTFRTQWFKMKLAVCAVIMVFAISTSLVWGQSDVQIYLDGHSMETGTGGALTQEGRTLVPMRSIFETFEFEVSWDSQLRKIDAVKQDYHLVLIVGSNTATVNSSQATLDVPASIISGRTYVPLRFISEILGAKVDYNGELNRVSIDTAELKKPISFSDPNMANAVMHALGKTPETIEDVFYVRTLDISNQSVNNIVGISSFKNLESLNASRNKITDIAELSKLDRLNTLNISENTVGNLNAVPEMKSLKELNASGNRIVSFRPLWNMSHLEKLWITNNQSKDYSPLYFIKDNLAYLDVPEKDIELPDYDLPHVYSDANFSTAVAPDVNWVPAVKLGLSSITNEDMQLMVKQGPEALKLNLNRVYSVIQYLAENDKLIRTPFNLVEKDKASVPWTVLPKGSELVMTNRAGSQELPVLVQYLLSSDYDESGYLAVLQENGTIQLLNYIRQDESAWIKNSKNENESIIEHWYYILNPEAYTPNAGERALSENGLLEEYTARGNINTAIHRVGNLGSILPLIQKTYPNAVMVFQLTRDDYLDTAFAYSYQKAERELTLPKAIEDKVNILYQVENGPKIIFREFEIEKRKLESYPRFNWAEHK